MSKLILTSVGGDPAQTVSLAADGEGAPSPGPGQVLVEVAAAPINPADFLLAAGWFGVQPTTPWAMGAEGVGRVVQVGPGVAEGLAGRRVIILPTFEQGTWAQRVVVAARNVIPVGERGDALQLAMLGVNPATAHAVLHRFATLEPGQWVGQNLGNSAVGQAVVALARRAGFKTLSVVRRPEGAKRLHALGADQVIAAAPDLEERIAAALGGERLSLVVDGVGGNGAAELVGALRDGGTVVSYSSQTGEPPVLALPDLIYRGISLRGFYIVEWVKTAPRKVLEATYAELAGLVEEGVLSAAVEATYPLSAYAAALTHAQNPERAGKILFTPGQD
jgi:NADPH:quinone reductase-like Zn-dependent oxidoreductase